MILGLAVLLGLVSGGSLTLCYTIGGLMVPEAVRTTAFGFFSGAALFGGALSPTVAGLVAHASLRGIYWVDAALYVALAVALARGRRYAPPPRRPPLELDSRHEDLSPLRPRASAVLREGGAHRGLPLLSLRPEGLPQLPPARPRGQQPVRRAPGRVADGQGQGELLRVLRVSRGVAPDAARDGRRHSPTRAAPAPRSTRSSARRSRGDDTAGRWRVGDGEEARLTPGARRRPRCGAGASCRCACGPRARIGSDRPSPAPRSCSATTPTRCSRKPSSPRTASSSTACAPGPRARSSAIASCTAGLRPRGRGRPGARARPRRGPAVAVPALPGRRPAAGGGAGAAAATASACTR